MSAALRINATPSEKRAALKVLIKEAANEQRNPTRTGYYPVVDFPFDTRVNQTYHRQALADALTLTEALEILDDIVNGEGE